MPTLSSKTRKMAVILTLISLLLITASFVQAAPGILGIFEFTCDANARCVDARNNGSGVGVYGFTKNGVEGGVRGIAANSNPFGIGVYGKAGYIGVVGEGQSGGRFTGDSVGATGESEDGYGLRGNSDTSIGVYGASTNAHGVYGTSNAGNTNYYGGRFVGTQRRGLYADGANGYYDARFPDCVRIGPSVYGSCAGNAPLSAGMSIIALNTGGESLAPGDVLVFKGMGSAEGVPDSVMLVDKASGAPGEVLVGVMQDAYQLDLSPPPAASDKDAPAIRPDDSGQTVAGNAEPGGLLFVQIQGIALVNVDASAGPIIAGSSLVTGSAGRASAMSSALGDSPDNLQILGRAMASLDSGSGTLFVLLGVR